jgi:predicted PurR-regulated permease PerM
MSEKMEFMSAGYTRWRHGLIVTLTVLVLLYFAYRLESILTPLMISLLVAYVLNPFVGGMEKRGIPRLLVILLVFISLAALITVAVAVVIPATLTQISELSRWIRGPEFSDFLKSHNSPRINHFIDQARQTLVDRGNELGQYVVKNVGTLVGSTFTVLNLLILIPLYTFFFLWRFDRVIQVLESYLPADRKSRIIHVVQQIDQVAANFFRGRLIVCLFIGASTAVGFAIIGLPFAWLLGIAAGILNLVPYFGPVSVLVPSLLVAYLHFHDIKHPIYTLATFSFFQMVDGFILTPVVQGKMIGLHPITTIVVLLMGGELAGVFGLILAVPAAAVIKILAREFLLPELLGQNVPLPILEPAKKQREPNKLKGISA